MRKDDQSWSASIWIAGDLLQAIAACRGYCMSGGLCVTVTPTTFVYTGGAEEGICVRLINYPRFPVTRDELRQTALHLADHLRCALCQHSYSVEFPDITVWDTLREQS